MAIFVWLFLLGPSVVSPFFARRNANLAGGFAGRCVFLVSGLFLFCLFGHCHDF